MASARSPPQLGEGTASSHGDESDSSREGSIAPKHAKKSSHSDLTAAAVASECLHTSDVHDDQAAHTGYRGRCLYKTGKCENERALKTNGQAHNLCDMHRFRQNQNQRKLDGKNRHNRTAYSPYDRNSVKGDSPAHTLLTGTDASVDPVKHEPLKMHCSRSTEASYTASKSTIELPPRTSNRHYLPPPPLQSMTHPPSPSMQYSASFPTSSLSTSSAFPSLPHMRRSTSQTLHTPPQQPASQPVKSETFTDDITVPTPSYLKGEAREAFRSRVLQKLVNIISEEVMTTTQQNHQQLPPPQQAYEMAPPQQYQHHHEYSASYGYPSSQTYGSAPAQLPHYPAPSTYHPNVSPPRAPEYDDDQSNSFYQHQSRMPPRFLPHEASASLPKLFPVAMPTSSSPSLPSLLRAPPKESVSPNSRSYLI
ncbi:hypothetical protein H310_07922 [Aphanomyces invadans]|uniref:Uncharacterized protein n=1 Tax=Aphanomyces invadans TaxID=157072 RepID=A0A024U0Z0_9STRA|nr:hypothetical protein H310_07922 [Aphanomyces invadans]ETV99888.1 hypothetical protein H310_07922 [Aphanomyces invadans]|eukprot:XP_008871664.1 hypothetical protein H310_07922 [Aphanomyces invadans]